LVPYVQVNLDVLLRYYTSLRYINTHWEAYFLLR